MFTKYIIQFILVLYAVYLISIFIPITKFGIVPRTSYGLVGIITAPFLHGSLRHLVSNTIPLLVFLFMMNHFYPKKIIPVVLFTIIVGGLLVWLLGRNASHIGASGLVYGLAAFLIANGFIEQKFVPLLISFAVIILYGGMIWGVFPSVYRYVSWESHLFGAIAGVLISYILKNKAIYS
jgi:membrane associated rhomboid family serine protease